MLKWYVAGATAAIAIAWLAALLQLADYAPLGLLPLAIGLAIGAFLGAIAATQRVAGRHRLIVGTVLLSLLTVFAEHAWLYRDFRRQWQEARSASPETAMFRPEEPWSPREYFERELTPQRAALWCLDAALITAAAAGTVWALDRHRCRFGLPADANRPTPDT
jgi:hypothetical protein